jgi:hypothetical protein
MDDIHPSKRREVFIGALQIYWDEKLYLDFPPNARMLQLAQSVGIDPLEIIKSYYHLIGKEKYGHGDQVGIGEGH